MAADQHIPALLGLLEKFDGRANGWRAVDLVSAILDCPRLPADLKPVIDALAAVRAARAAEDEARQATEDAELRLAELVQIRRRDKDMGFEAEHEAERLLVAAVLASRHPAATPTQHEEIP
jgi:hypothetical protein